MKLRAARILLFLVPSTILMGLSGCVHTYPSESALTPENSEITLHIYPDTETDAYPSTENGKPAAGNPVSRGILKVQLFVLDRLYDSIEKIADLSNGNAFDVNMKFSQPITGIYAWWCPLELETTQNKYFDFADLCKISFSSKLNPFSVYNDCQMFSGLPSLSAANEDSERLEADIHMSRLMGAFKIVPSDYAEFLEIHDSEIRRNEKFTMQIQYKTGVASGFDVYANETINPIDDKSIKSNLEISYIPGLEIAAAYDRIPIPENGCEIELSAILLNEALAAVSRTEGIKIRLQRGKTTIVRTKLLTNPISGGFAIDPTWGNEVIIEF